MPQMPGWTPDPEKDLILDARSMRAVAHPLRIRIMGILRLEGPQTSTTLATKLGLNSGATSYHLRQLADHGLILEAPELGTGRERWWRVPTRSTYMDRAHLDEEGIEVSATYLRAIGLYYAEHLQRAIEEAVVQPEEWRPATTFSDYAFCLTPEEANRMLTELRGVMERYRPYRGVDDTPGPVGAEVFQVLVHAFRAPSAETT